MQDLVLAVCDDQKSDRLCLAQMLREACLKRGITPQVHLFVSGQDLLTILHTEGQYHIFFLDIYMPGLSGMETARAIRKIDLSGGIVFVTTSVDHGVESFEVQAMDYLVKPLQQDNVSNVIDWYCSHPPESARSLTVFSDWTPQEIPIRSILFIEILGHQAHIHLKDRVVVTRRGLDDLERTIQSKDFLRCHRSYLVNLNHVASLLKNDFQMTDGSRVLISRANLNRIRNAFMDWSCLKAWEKM